MTRQHPSLRYLSTHITGAELAGGAATTEAEVTKALRALSVYDCIRMIGRLSAELYVSSGLSLDVQKRLVEDLTPGQDELRRRLLIALRAGSVVVFEQQLVHLARMVFRHAADRPADSFAGGADIHHFLIALFGVTDLFEEDLGDETSSADVMSWQLKQTGLNRSEERLTLWSLYYEVLHDIWPTLDGPEVLDLEAAFKRYTKLSLSRFISLGFAFSVGLSGRDDEHLPPRAELDPDHWFSTARVEEADWRAFLAQTARSASEIRAALDEEDRRYGPTTYGALTFEQSPLLQAPDGGIYLINLGALERRSTQGLFHILAEGAQAEGEDRERFTTPFGAAFQRWVEACFERAQGMVTDAPVLVIDQPYGPPSRRRQTPDVTLRYPRDLMAVEVVAGTMHAATMTRGDLETFERDQEKFVLKKARQLTNRLADIEAGETCDVGLDPAGVERWWPVIVAAPGFPHRPEIMQAARQRLKRDGLLQGRGRRTIAILSAEELAAAEAFFERGISFLDLIRGWKSHARTGDHYFKNYLSDYDVGGERPGHARHHQEVFDRASREMFRELFGRETPPDPPTSS